MQRLYQFLNIIKICVMLVVFSLQCNTNMNSPRPSGNAGVR
ncbi:hypothetical protein Riv7116_6374 [Rivularia sp. PCC 7116]|nr:hypothetical protein Riv7116_6374 [Rivularia sp. PCC 7116]